MEDSFPEKSKENEGRLMGILKPRQPVIIEAFGTD